MDYLSELQDMCETLSREIKKANEKIRDAGGKLSAGDLEYVDKLTHALKSVKATVKMMEEEEEGYSGRYPYMGGVYNGSDSGTYARGRNRNARRDSMGRYSGEHGYSRNDLADKMRDLMEDAPDERTRQEIRRMIEKLENA